MCHENMAVQFPAPNTTGLYSVNSNSNLQVEDARMSEGREDRMQETCSTLHTPACTERAIGV